MGTITERKAESNEFELQEKLLQCPFCGGKAFFHAEIIDGPRDTLNPAYLLFVSCRTCKARSGYGSESVVRTSNIYEFEVADIEKGNRIRAEVYNLWNNRKEKK